MQELVGDLKNVIDPLKETTEKEILKLQELHKAGNDQLLSLEEDLRDLKFKLRSGGFGSPTALLATAPPSEVVPKLEV